MTEKYKKSDHPKGKQEPIDQHKKSIGKSAARSEDQKETSEKKTEKTGVKSEDRNDPTGNSHLSSKK